MPKTTFFSAVILAFVLSFCTAYSQSTQYLDVKSYQDKSSYSPKDTIKAAFEVKISEKYHINSHRTNDPTLVSTILTVPQGPAALSSVYFPADKKLKFEFSSTEIFVYEGTIYIGAKLLLNGDVKDSEVKIPVVLSYQACDDKVCYSPKKFTDTLTIKISQTPGSSSNQEIFSKIDFNAPTATSTKDSGTKLTENARTDSVTSSEEETVSNWIEEKGLAVTLLLIFLGGLALNLTPCVYPLIPITISYFGAQGSGSKSQSIMMGVFYALGMSVTYSALGLFAATTGSLLGNALQNPIVVIVLAIIFIALSLSMFGLYEIKVPQSLAQMGNKNRTGYAGSLLMGLTVGFIAAPCIGPFVLSLLVYVGKLGNPFMGFLMFFILSMGLGFPYIILAASSSSLAKLPRSGEWMLGVKIIFGLLLVGMALNTLAPLIPNEIFNVVFPLYIIGAGIYLIMFDKHGMTAPFYQKFKYLAAIAAIVAGTWILKPQGHEGGEVAWQNATSLETVTQSISTGGKPIMIDFYADWCAQCKELDAYTYTDPEVIELSKTLNNIKIDLTQENTAISDKFDIKGLPVVIFMNSKGEEIKSLRVTGFLKPQEFKERINKLLDAEKQLTSK